MEIKKIAIVLADISGYTEFIQSHKTAMIHAEHIISQLLEIVIDQAEYPLILNKLEGDAILLYSELGDSETDAIRDITNQVNTFFSVFHKELNTLSEFTVANCPCEACQTAGRLKLKAILHKGNVIFKKIRQFEELAGEEMIFAHRLLKNNVSSREYILMSEPFYLLLDNELYNSSKLHQETYDGFGTVNLKVFYPKIH